MMYSRFQIAENHHQALAFWADNYTKHGAMPVLTFDHHTDTRHVLAHIPDSNIQADGLVAAFDAANPVSVCHAIKLLHHDEQFDFALRTGIFSRVYGVVHFISPAAEADMPDGINLTCDRSWGDENTLLNNPSRFSACCCRVLETDWLEARFSEIGFSPETRPFVLDIDLDFFVTLRALYPKEHRLFYRLLQNCALLTVSMEREWVKILSVNRATTADSLLSGLLEHYSIAGTDRM